MKKKYLNKQMIKFQKTTKMTLLKKPKISKNTEFDYFTKET